ncbi:uncharacterized protein [Notamacropus eugenii]|uniref:uncharacterized protein n=1 Tax=Notamacropus eugenii TaxID=9315 RepID=UPI003B6849AD
MYTTPRKSIPAHSRATGEAVTEHCRPVVTVLAQTTRSGSAGGHQRSSFRAQGRNPSRSDLPRAGAAAPKAGRPPLPPRAQETTPAPIPRPSREGRASPGPPGAVPVRVPLPLTGSGPPDQLGPLPRGPGTARFTARGGGGLGPRVRTLVRPRPRGVGEPKGEGRTDGRRGQLGPRLTAGKRADGSSGGSGAMPDASRGLGSRAAGEGTLLVRSTRLPPPSPPPSPSTTVAVAASGFMANTRAPLSLPPPPPPRPEVPVTRPPDARARPVRPHA